MVTGVETAGLVLASLPIVVQVLTEYRSGLRKTLFLVRKSKAYENKVGKLARQLRILQTNLKQVLVRVIGAAAPDVWSGEVPKDYRNELWTGETGNRIKTYLEGVDAFDTFESIIEEFEEHLLDVAESLIGLLTTPGADPRDLRAIVDGHNKSGGHFRLRGKVEFIMRESQINTAVEELKTLSGCLESLVGNSDSVHHMKQLKASSKQNGYAKALYAVQRHAHAFFKALRSSWDQSCHPSHETLLHLEDRCSVQSSRATPSHAHPALTFIALLRKDPARGDVLLTWHQTHVSVFENHLSETLLPASATPLSQQAVQRPRFVLPMNTDPTTQGDQHVPIQDMCRVLLEIGPRTLFVSADSRLFRPAVQNTPTPLEPNEGHNTLELKELLRRKPNLSPMDKFRFALSIASSLLQLNLTPWICKCWTKDDIWLRRERSADCGYDVAHPLIRGRFEESTSCQRSEDDPEAALLELGILLVEVWTEKTMEAWVESIGRAYADLSDLALRRGLLYDWWNELRKKAPPNYCQVVQICFFPGEFGDVDKSWDDVQFKALYYTNIVEPLSKDLEELLQMQGGP